MLVNNTESLRNWFRKCPEISRNNRFRADYLAEGPTEYAIMSVPSTLKYHENILGEEVLDDDQVQNFIFASKEVYGADVQQNLANLAFYQSIVNWIIDRNNAKDFPEWDGGRIRSILPTLTAYPAQVGSNVAKYQIQLRINYRRN